MRRPCARSTSSPARPAGRCGPRSAATAPRCTRPGRTAPRTSGTSPVAGAPRCRRTRWAPTRAPNSTRPTRRPSSTPPGTARSWRRARPAYLVDVISGKPSGPAINIGSARHQWPDLSADGSRLAIGLADGRGRVWDVPTRQLLFDVRARRAGRPADRAVVNAGLSGDGHTVAFATYLLPPANRTEIAFYDVASGRRLDATWQIEGSGANRFGRQPRRPLPRRHHAAGSPRSGTCRHARGRPAAAPAGAARCVARFSRDGRYLAVGNGIGRPTMWRVEDWSLPGRPRRGHNGYDVAVSFSPDGTVLASSGSDSKIFLYDVNSGEMLGEAFGPDRNSWLYAEFKADRNETRGLLRRRLDGPMGRRPGVPDPDRLPDRRPGAAQAEWDRLVPAVLTSPICPQ